MTNLPNVVDFRFVERDPDYDKMNNPSRRKVAEPTPVAITWGSGGVQRDIRNITTDPIGLRGGLHLHQYVLNPIEWVAPLGLARIPNQLTRLRLLYDARSRVPARVPRVR